MYHQRLLLKHWMEIFAFFDRRNFLNYIPVFHDFPVLNTENVNDSQRFSVKPSSFQMKPNEVSIHSCVANINRSSYLDSIKRNEEIYEWLFAISNLRIMLNVVRTDISVYGRNVVLAESFVVKRQYDFQIILLLLLFRNAFFASNVGSEGRCRQRCKEICFLI